MPRFLQGREEQMEKKQKAQSLGHIAQQMQIKAAQVFQKRGAAEEGCCPAPGEEQTKTTELLRECEPVGVGAGQKSHSAWGSFGDWMPKPGWTDVRGWETFALTKQSQRP